MNRRLFLKEALMENKNQAQIMGTLVKYAERKAGIKLEPLPGVQTLDDGTSGMTFMFGEAGQLRIRWPQGNFKMARTIDVWTDFQLDEQGNENRPQYTITVPPGSIMSFMPQIAEWLKNPTTGAIQFDLSKALESDDNMGQKLDPRIQEDKSQVKDESLVIQTGQAAGGVKNLTENPLAAAAVRGVASGVASAAVEKLTEANVFYNGEKFKNKHDAVYELLKRGMSREQVSKAVGARMQDIDLHISKAKANVSAGADVHVQPSQGEMKNQEMEEMAEEGEWSDPTVIFDDINFELEMLVDGSSNGLIVAGDPGIGKTYNIGKFFVNKFEDLFQEKVYIVKGSTTTKSLYATLFLHNGEFIMFDDTDSLWKDPEAANILKAALDDKKERLVSWNSEKCFKVERGMEGNQEELMAEFETTGMYPNRFFFTGRIVFISNMYKDKFDKAVLARVPFIELNLKPKDIYQLIHRLGPTLEYPGDYKPTNREFETYFEFFKANFKKYDEQRKSGEKPSIRYFTSTAVRFWKSDDANRERRIKHLLR